MEQNQAVLFADVSGSAKLYERLGEAEAERAVDRCMKRMERAIDGHGGRLISATGGEAMVLFRSADKAYQSAQEMLQRVADLPPVSGVQLAIRIGFHVGPVEQVGDQVSGETVNTTAHIVGMAEAGQILTSLQAVALLPPQVRDAARDLGQATAKSGGVQVYEMPWQRPDETIPISVKKSEASTATPSAAPVEGAVTAKLCLRYRGRAYLLDTKTPFLSLGRDKASDVVIEDRKASRHHALIERRGDKFFYVDRSTNGSYVTLDDTPETMVRRAELPLLGNGSICFGSSVNDPAADCATFEFL
ncbi:MAG: FHA domain-containing protein [Actinomycetota bacterium]